MKPVFFEDFKRVFDRYLPENIAEIGTHNAASACQFVDYLIPRVPRLFYTGYDMFDAAVTELSGDEGNGKGPGYYQDSFNKLQQRRAVHGNFDFELVVGETTQSFTQPRTFDFVYIDGGHSYPTVRHDYNMVRGSRVIVFDDVQLSGVRQLVDEIRKVETNYVFEDWHRPQVHKRRQVAMFLKS